MIRSALSVVSGAGLWALLWVASNAALAASMPHVFSEGARIDSVPHLTLILALSVAFSIIAGYVTARVARHGEIGHTLALGILQLGLGIFFQSQYWEQMPIWYHLSFLALLIPGNVLGGFVRLNQRLKLSPGV